MGEALITRVPVPPRTHRLQKLPVLEGRDVDAAQLADHVAGSDAGLVRRATGHHIRDLVVIDALRGTARGGDDYPCVWSVRVLINASLCTCTVFFSLQVHSTPPAPNLSRRRVGPGEKRTL